jgi:clorobiocin biosynthesis protein CloN6
VDTIAARDEERPRELRSLPTTRADLLLIHAPAFFDFRDRADIYFPYLSTSGDVPITPLYEYFPVGFKTLQRYLGERGHDVKIVNLASVLLRFPRIDIGAFVRAMDVRVFGIDLHWMVHVQGALEIARLLKTTHPDVPVILGGISSTYYADELIGLPYVDMVMRGYDTHEPMLALMDALRSGGSLSRVPNLLWKDQTDGVVDNGMAHLPSEFACGIDWAEMPPEPGRTSLPILEVLSMQNAGCSYNCPWCGGSRSAFERVFGKRPAMARKSLDQVAYEFETMARIPRQERYHFYSVGSYNEPRKRFAFFLDQVAGSNFRSISYEQFQLTPDDVLDAMVRAHPRTTITLSPESHDVRVATLAGRGVYSMDEMERWIAKALDKGIHAIDIWFFIGMPEQDERSVFETVDYCGRLLERFEGQRVTPFLCPMIPFLDPASTFFVHPEDHGYTVFHRTVDEHRRGMERASLVNRINYETRWLSRRDLVRVGYEAVHRLVELKGEVGMMPASVGRSVVAKIEDALEWIWIVDEIDAIRDERVRRRELDRIGGEILTRNTATFFSGVSNQAFPVARDVGGRWFDELLVDPSVLEALEPAR